MMKICLNYAFCTRDGTITQNVFASPEDAEMWASRLADDGPGTLYMEEDGCWVPDMVFGLPDDDLSVVARGMAFVGAMKGADYAQALEDYIACEELPDEVKENLRGEISRG